MDAVDSDAVHVHHFRSITTTRLRYTPLGDLANNVYLSQVEIYASEP